MIEAKKEAGRKIGEIVITFRKGEKAEFVMTGTINPREISAMPYNLRIAFRQYSHRVSKASIASKKQEIADAKLAELAEANKVETVVEKVVEPKVVIPKTVTPVADKKEAVKVVPSEKSDKGAVKK